MNISFSVLGVPVPGGSKKAWLIHQAGCPAARRNNPGQCACKPHIAMMDAAGDRNKHWRYRISAEARVAMREAGIAAPLRGPLRVEFVFMIPRPKGHFNAKGFVAPRFIQAHPTGRPDAIKLARAAEDALNQVLWEDDCQNIDVRSVKIYSETPGVNISVSSVISGASQALPFQKSLVA